MYDFGWPLFPFALNCNVNGPVITKSDAGAGVPPTVTPEMEHEGDGSHKSVSFTRIVTGSSFLLGGLMTLGDATAEVITGATSVTVTDVAQEFMFPEPSVAVQVTGVVPSPKVEPEPGTQLDVTAGQLSKTVGVTVTAAPAELVQLTEVGAGHEIFGFWVSFTVTFAAQCAEAWSGPLSTTESVTGVVPSVYGPAGV
jgi:hypothetical protein